MFEVYKFESNETDTKSDSPEVFSTLDFLQYDQDFFKNKSFRVD